MGLVAAKFRQSTNTRQNKVERLLIQSFMNAHFLRVVRACAVIWRRVAFSLQRKPINFESYDKLL